MIKESDYKSTPSSLLRTYLSLPRRRLTNWLMKSQIQRDRERVRGRETDIDEAARGGLIKVGAVWSCSCAQRHWFVQQTTKALSYITQTRPHGIMLHWYWFEERWFHCYLLQKWWGHLTIQDQRRKRLKVIIALSRFDRLVFATSRQHSHFLFAPKSGRFRSLKQINFCTNDTDL